MMLVQIGKFASFAGAAVFFAGASWQMFQQGWTPWRVLATNGLLLLAMGVMLLMLAYIVGVVERFRRDWRRDFP